MMMKKALLLFFCFAMYINIFAQYADKTKNETITGKWTFNDEIKLFNSTYGETTITPWYESVNTYSNDIYERNINRSIKLGGSPLNTATTVANSWIFSHEWGTSAERLNLGAETVKMRGAASNKKWQWAIRTGGYNGREILSINNEENGLVGINQSNPSEALDVNGNIKIKGNIYCERNFSLSKGLGTGEHYGITLHKDGINAFSGGNSLPYNHGMIIESDALVTFSESDENAIQGWMDLNASNFIWNGNIGIGCINPQEKLSVNGTILAKEVRVSADAADWPDFVFESDYNLRDLSEVEAFIEENKHLPEILCAAQMEKQGVNLAEINKLLLQKVEELTLYAIEKDKEVQVLKSDVAEIKAMLIGSAQTK